MDSDTAARTRSSAAPSCAFIQFEEMFKYEAHVVHILVMCDALTTCGVETTLYMLPPTGTAEPSPAELVQAYGLSNTPRIAWIPHDANKWIARLRVVAESFRAGRRFTYTFTTRGLPTLGALLGGARQVIMEIHQPSTFWSQHDRLAFRLARHSRRLQIVCISKRLAEKVAEEWGLEESAIIAEHSGHNFPIRDDYRVDSAAGRRLRALYVGSFDPGKGLGTVFEVAALHPSIDFVVVGGEAPDGALPDNVSVQARAPHNDVPDLLSQADILLMPFTTYAGDSSSSEVERGAEEFYSPLKMVEYLAAGRAIVSSNLPSIAEVLVDGSNCLLVDPPDSIQAWSMALGRMEKDAVLREHLARGAAQTAARHTALERTRRILDGVGART